MHVPLLTWQVYPVEQVPQFKVPLHPLDIFPQFLPRALQVVGTQGATH
jgi:hypothetical protein